MDIENLKTILRAALEKEIPPAQIELWPAVEQRLVARKHPLFRQGEKMKSNPASRMKLAIAIMAIVFGLSLLALAAPQGQAFAQRILQFFTRAESDTLPLQPFQQTSIPTLAAESTPEKPFPLTIDEAQTLAGYKVFVPTDTKGHNFYGAEYDPARKTVSINFSDPEIGFGNGFLITEQLLAASADIYPLQGVVGASAPVETVQIGNVPGEYVMGVWNLTDNGPVWQPEPSIQTLRWKTDTTFFEIVYQGTKLTKDDLLAIAESLK
jgi:hypothetical protein